MNPANFRRSIRQSTGDMIVSAAGPLSNLLLGALAAVTLGVVFRVSPEAVRPGGGALGFLQRLMIVNAGLAIFNPSRCRRSTAATWPSTSCPPACGRREQFARFSPFFLIALIVFGRSIIYPPVIFVFGLLQQLTFHRHVEPDARTAPHHRQRHAAHRMLLHLGHLHGALANRVRLQEENDCYFFSADWHALTTNYHDTGIIKRAEREMFVDFIAAGVDPEKATLFVQSEVKEHAELYLLLGMITPARLARAVAVVQGDAREHHRPIRGRMASSATLSS